MMEEELQQEETLEVLFGQLDEIIEKMEASDVPLETAFALYEQGMRQIHKCNEKLDRVEKKMLVISGDGTEVPFE